MATNVDTGLLRKAVSALLEHDRRRDEATNNGKEALFAQERTVFLQVGLKTIPKKRITKPHRIRLPHPLYVASSQGVCLIVKTTVKKNMKTLMQESGTGSITKVLSVQKLRQNYREFEAKRKLSDSFDLFLADKRVLPLLPKLLGKSFFVKKKYQACPC